MSSSGPRLGRPAPARFLSAVVLALEDRRRQRGPHMERFAPDIAETMAGAGRDQDGLVCLDDLLVALEPDLGATGEHFQHFFDRMDVGWRAETRIAKLIEDAELPPTEQIGHPHPGQDALAPRLERLVSVIEDIHGGSLLREEVGVGFTRRVAGTCRARD